MSKYKLIILCFAGWNVRIAGYINTRATQSTWITCSFQHNILIQFRFSLKSIFPITCHDRSTLIWNVFSYIIWYNMISSHSSPVKGSFIFLLLHPVMQVVYVISKERLCLSYRVYLTISLCLGLFKHKS